MRRRQNVDAKATENLRNVGFRNVDATTRPAHALDIRDNLLAFWSVLEKDREKVLAGFFGGLVVGDVTLFFENSRDFDLQPRRRHIDFLMFRLNGIPY